MVHVKQQKKMASVSAPPQEQTIACVSTNTISRIDDTTRESRETRPPYPERLNAEQLISQINCRTINNTHTTTTTNDINNDSNNNSNTNNTSTNRNSNQHTCRGVSIDLEKGPIRRHHRHQRPLYRRVFTFIRNLWRGAKFSVSKDDCELEELEAPPRYRPDSLSSICKTTRFSEPEIKRMYRGFKAHCPNGTIKEDVFKIIYAQFFPQGANTGLYAHYVFNTLDKEHTGTLSFEKFVQGLSILSRGTLEEKLCWTFQLYDINGDGRITKEEMNDIVTAIYNLMGHPTEEKIDEDRIKAKVERIFNKMDRNHDGVVTIDEFLNCCKTDQAITNSMLVFDSTI